MRKLCRNYDFEDGLDTVLEVPMPEEMFGSGNKHGSNSWLNMKSWIKPYAIGRMPLPPFLNNGSTAVVPAPNADVQLLLGVIGAPLIPLPLDSAPKPSKPTFKNQPMESSMAKYIIEQYIGAVGGEKVLNSITSMYAMGKVKMVASEVSSGGVNDKSVKVKPSKTNGAGEMGGFVLWQKRPDLWSLELVLSGCKISAGSNGKLAWRQTPWHHSQASRGPPRPLRRALQGLDPKSTARLFADAVCIGEKVISDESCFILKLEAKVGSLKARSTRNVEIIRHVIWGCFSQRTGLLTQLEDSHILRIKPPGVEESVFWETTMESSIGEYREVDGMQIAHSGTTAVSLFRFGETSERQSRTRMEERWMIEEVDFNIVGLTLDCFLPPGDLRKGEDEKGARRDPCLPPPYMTAARGVEFAH